MTTGSSVDTAKPASYRRSPEEDQLEPAAKSMDVNASIFSRGPTSKNDRHSVLLDSKNTCELLGNGFLHDGKLLCPYFLRVVRNVST